MCVLGFVLIWEFLGFFSSALKIESGLALALTIWVQFNQISDTFGIPWTAPESIMQHK